MPPSIAELADVTGACPVCLGPVPAGYTYCTPAHRTIARRRARDRLPIGVPELYCPYPTKVRYPTEADALGALKSHHRRWKEGMTPYECRCGWWHLGHPKKEE